MAKEHTSALKGGMKAKQQECPPIPSVEASIHRRKHDVPGDNSCLYHLRKQMVDFMRHCQILKDQIVHDKELLLGCWEYRSLALTNQTDDEFVSKFISCHLESDCWGGNICIAALAMLLQRDMVCLDASPRRPMIQVYRKDGSQFERTRGNVFEMYPNKKSDAIIPDIARRQETPVIGYNGSNHFYSYDFYGEQAEVLDDCTGQSDCLVHPPPRHLGLSEAAFQKLDARTQLVVRGIEQFTRMICEWLQLAYAPDAV